ncbi:MULTISPECIES: hypothetical protein [Bacillus]|uniref:hypothetical protein n=2 Tax=Bacillaceae TaxID=186817 RepID=UPI000BAFC2EA|nr:MULTISPECIES: hypothetical protein [Bacillus]ASZ16677.1 hypothetical protein CK938_08685 [Bacillus cereus]MCM0004596.1 hypothetical protein [Bacillus paranthracis]MDA1955041.1 hypothetical protein [Bacillus cereus group sp. BcHK114]
MMNIQSVMEKAKSELPGYKLIGYFEKGFPQFKRRLLCLMLKEKKLPVIDEFVLRLHKVDIDLLDMSLILGIDLELIKDSWYNLIHFGLIQEETKQVTEAGHHYLRENKIDGYEKLHVDIYIDGLTGKITKNQMYMNNKSAKQINLDVLSPLYSLPEVESIDRAQVKKVIESYRMNDPENFTGNLVDVLKIEGKSTFYKRMFVFICRNHEGDIQFLVYDGIKRREEYEDPLKELEENGFAVSKEKVGKYFADSSIQYINKYQNEKQLSSENVLNEFNRYLENVKKEISISLPLIKKCTPNDFIISRIKQKLKDGIKINLVASGKEFVDSYQKNQYEKILKLRDTYSNFRVFHVSEYQNKILLMDGKEGIVSSFVQSELNLPTSEYSLAEYGYPLKKEQIVSCMHEKFGCCTDQIIKHTSLNSQQLKQKIKCISELVNEFDEQLLQLNDMGWIGGEVIPNLQQFLDVPLCKTENQFKVFISSLHISLIESFDRTVRANGKKQYFWNEFKTEFPELQKILHKIRLYRHSTEHISLEEKYKEKYFQFMEEDLNCSIPLLVEKGYLILQEKILSDLESVLRFYLKKKIEI